MTTDIRTTLEEHNQHRILRCLDLLDQEARAALLDDLAAVDFAQVAELYRAYRTRDSEPGEKTFQAAELTCTGTDAAGMQERARLTALGEDALCGGHVAVFLVAGGQGSRLGFEGPKGCFPVSPLQSKTLFQLFAEQVLALKRRYRTRLPWLILTSSENNQATCDFFAANSYFGLGPDDVQFIIQKQIPSLDLDGQLIAGREGRLFKNPNGHGGSLYALHDSGALQRLAGMGIEEIFYFQVDNPLAKIADPLFIGAHLDQQADISTKVVRKTDPAEKVGVIGRVNGRLACIEYSELTPQQTAEKAADGSLRFKSANIAIHMLNRRFVEKLNNRPDFHLPYHIAVKDIACLGCETDRLAEQTIRGIKFEMFIFDALGFAERSVTLEVPREEEFSPVKNASGSDSPETARQAMLQQHRRWIEQAAPARAIPRDLQVEISPLFALDAAELQAKLPPDTPLTSPLYLE